MDGAVVPDEGYVPPLPQPDADLLRLLTCSPSCRAIPAATCARHPRPRLLPWPGPGVGMAVTSGHSDRARAAGERHVQVLAAGRRLPGSDLAQILAVMRVNCIGAEHPATPGCGSTDGRGLSCCGGRRAGRQLEAPRGEDGTVSYHRFFAHIPRTRHIPHCLRCVSPLLRHACLVAVSPSSFAAPGPPPSLSGHYFPRTIPAGGYRAASVTTPASTPHNRADGPAAKAAKQQGPRAWCRALVNIW